MDRYKTKNGFRFRSTVYLANGKRLSKSFSRKTDADLWKSHMKTQVSRGHALGISWVEDVDFRSLCKEWLDLKIKPFSRPKTYAGYFGETHKHLIPLLGSMKISSVNKGHANQLIACMKADGYSARTINKMLERLKQILSYAVDTGRCPVNILSKYKGVSEPPQKEVYLTSSEISQLLRANLNNEIYPIITFALNTGMRLGEIAGLKFDRLNFQTNQIEVSRTYSNGLLSETTKTHKVRYVPMNSEAKRILERQITKQLSNEYVFVLQNKLSGSYHPLDTNHLSQRGFKQALLRAGINRHIRFHDLRHTYASHFMMNGGSIYDLQKILGHSDLSTTMRYAHLSPQHLSQVADTVCFRTDDTNSEPCTHLTLISAK